MRNPIINTTFFDRLRETSPLLSEAELKTARLLFTGLRWDVVAEIAPDPDGRVCYRAVSNHGAALIKKCGWLKKADVLTQLESGGETTGGA